MMKPQLTKQQQQALTELGKADPNTLDVFSKHCRAKIGQLSARLAMGIQQIEQGEKDLENAKQQITSLGGEYAGVADSYVAYKQTLSAAEATPPADGGDKAPEPATEAAGEAAVSPKGEAGGNGTPEPNASQGDAEEVPEDAKESEPDPS